MASLRIRALPFPSVRPGLGPKKWWLLGLLALCLVGLGVGLIVADLYRAQVFPAQPAQLTPEPVSGISAGLVLVATGLALGLMAAYHVSRSLLQHAIPSPRPAIQTAIRRSQLLSGPKVIAIGGGTGLSTLLRGLKEVTTNITAVVTVADDGGSSGRLRHDYGVLPLGDLRQCLVALADAEPLMGELLQHRFAEQGELNGHCLGNLFLMAMAEVTGSLDQALEECSRVLLLRGQVVPSTLASITLCGELEDGRVVRGESSIAHAGSRIRRVFLEPGAVPAHPAALQAIEEADAIIIGPGSLYTSVLPNLLVADLLEAIRRSPARKIFVSNVANEKGETSGFQVSDFLRVVEEHVGPLEIDFVLANSNLLSARPGIDAPRLVELVRPDDQPEELHREERPRVVMADLIDEVDPTRHDAGKLETVLGKLTLARSL